MVKKLPWATATSRLQSMADAEAIVTIPEGQTVLPAGLETIAQLLTYHVLNER
jgi:hypothetical protein